jgi:hypothetical protein
MARNDIPSANMPVLDGMLRPICFKSSNASYISPSTESTSTSSPTELAHVQARCNSASVKYSALLLPLLYPAFHSIYDEHIIMPGQHTLPDLPYPYEPRALHLPSDHGRECPQRRRGELCQGWLSQGAHSSPMAIKLHSDGHVNHSLFWKNLTPASAEGRGVGGYAQGCGFVSCSR